jgi:hypothetical protein
MSVTTAPDIWIAATTMTSQKWEENWPLEMAEVTDLVKYYYIEFFIFLSGFVKYFC